MCTEYFLIAKIVSTEGDHGFLKINSLSDYPERFNKLKKIYIDFWGEKKIFTLQSVVRKRGSFVIKFKNFNDKKSVEELLGREIFIDREDLIKLPKGHYFVHDIMDCKVLRNGSEFGIVTDVYSLESNDVFVIKRLDEEEILIPAVKEYIESIDIKNRVLTLKPGEDIYEKDEN